MNPDAVRKALTMDPELPKEVRLNDGTRLVIRSREHWATGNVCFFVIAGGEDHFISYRNIAEIRVIRSKRGRRSG